MKLYSYWRSSSAWRVRIVLHLKALPFDIVPVHLVRDGGEQYAPAHLARNPMAQVPVLQLDDGATLSQSVAIAEYLDEIAPAPPLMPRGAADRAHVRQLVEIVNSGVQPLQNLKVIRAMQTAGGDPNAWGRQVIEDGLAALQSVATPRAGAFLFGDAPGLADAFLVPQLYNARRFGCDLSALTLLTDVEAACTALPAFQRAHPDAQPDAPPADQRTP
ncbi:MAG: maleylacetoacetate isomerase [Alphaproteobacteria bacterium]|nr:maleylacetoacetate isomerase [Alphaproteobacteria bacterium]